MLRHLCVVAALVVFEAGAFGATPAYAATAGDQFVGTQAGDHFNGTSGNDLANLFGGNDVASGGAGQDNLRGAGGNDRLIGGRGADQLAGGAGSDRLVPGPGHDHVWGGDGDDVIELSIDGDRDLIDCGDGFDRLLLDGGSDDRDRYVDCEAISIRIS